LANLSASRSYFFLYDSLNDEYKGMKYEAQGLLTTSVSHLLRSISLRNQAIVSDLAWGSGISEGGDEQ